MAMLDDLRNDVRRICELLEDEDGEDDEDG
jgi:hypothetical protein